MHACGTTVAAAASEKLLNAGIWAWFLRCPDAGHPAPKHLAKPSVSRLTVAVFMRASLVTEAVPGSGEMSFSASVGFQARIKLAHFGWDSYVLRIVPYSTIAIPQNRATTFPAKGTATVCPEYKKQHPLSYRVPPCPVPQMEYHYHRSHHLNSLKGDYIGDYYRGEWNPTKHVQAPGKLLPGTSSSGHIGGQLAACDGLGFWGFLEPWGCVGIAKREQSPHLQVCSVTPLFKGFLGLG